MIILQRTQPLILKKLEALASRVPRHFPKLQALECDIACQLRDFQGKQKVDFYLEQLPKEFLVLNDVCLKNTKQFQIDSLIITPRAIFIIKIKTTTHTESNLADNHMYTAQKSHSELNHILSQAELLQINLHKWLERHNLNYLPIHFLIVISNPSANTFVNYDDHITKTTTYAEHLPAKLIQFYKLLKYDSKENSQVVDQIIQTVLEKNEQFNVDVFDKYRINKSLILTGVRCNKCNRLKMRRLNSSWKCQTCKIEQELAHKEALNDYFTLLKDTITNRECKWFLNINSKKIATQLLKEENLTYESKRRRWVRDNETLSKS